jgi:hypothetical protein
MFETQELKRKTKWLANVPQDEIFHTAEKVFIFCLFQDQKIQRSHTTSHFTNGKTRKTL